MGLMATSSTVTTMMNIKVTIKITIKVIVVMTIMVIVKVTGMMKIKATILASLMILLGNSAASDSPARPVLIWNISEELRRYRFLVWR